MLAVLVPFRARGEQEFRAQQLREFREHMAAYLADTPHRLVVAEQAGDGPFNRGKLLNVAFLEALRTAPAGAQERYVQHNVDCLPRALDYAAAPPGEFADLYGESRDCAGQVLLHDRAAFEAVNGYPNDVWGWGAEDVALCSRAHAAGVRIDRSRWSPRWRPEVVLEHGDHPRDESTNWRNLGQVAADVAAGRWRSNGLRDCAYRVLAEARDDRGGVHVTAELE